MKTVLIFITSLFIFSGCVFEDTADDVDVEESIEHNSVSLSDISNTIITFKSTSSSSEFSYKFCTNGKLYYGKTLDDQGTYTVNGNTLEIIETADKSISVETSGSLKKNTPYTFSPDDFKATVVTIKDTVCGNL